MLEIINYNREEYDYPALIVLGCFDALHVGHAELLKKAKLQAKINGLDLGVMMFAEGKGGRQVFTFEERLEMLAPYNTKFVLKIDYNDEFKKTLPLDFLKVLEEHINVKGYMSGKDFRFGAGAKGKSSTLKNYSDDEDNAVWYMPVKDVVVDGEKVSTTLIKRYLEEGKIQQANKLLGREYFITGTVCRGHGRGGSELGFPTANITYPEDKVLVAEGVYGVEVIADGVTYKGVANFGGRPTFGEESPVLEAYLEDFSGDLYGKTVTLKFLNCIRSTVAFENSEALSAQIADDLGRIGCPDAQPVAAEPVQEATEPPVQEEVEATAEQVEEIVYSEAEVPAAPAAAEPEEKETFEPAAEEESEPENNELESDEEEIFDSETIDDSETAEEVFYSATPVEYSTEAEVEEIAEEKVEAAEEATEEVEDISEEPAEEEAEVISEESAEDIGDDLSKELADVDGEIAAIEAELCDMRSVIDETLNDGSDDDIAENELDGPADVSIFGDDEGNKKYD